MFGFWDRVGGRYSMDSAIGPSTMLTVGPDNYRDLLAGFHAMDTHFRTAPFEQNLPVLMGLLAVRYGDFFGAQTVGVMPYDQYLKRFPAWLTSYRALGTRVVLYEQSVFTQGTIGGRLLRPVGCRAQAPGGATWRQTSPCRSG